GRTRVRLRRGHHAARRAGPQRTDVQVVPAIHREPQGAADRTRSPVPAGREPLPVDERDDRPEEGTQLLRNAGHRIPDGRRPELGLTTPADRTRIEGEPETRNPNRKDERPRAMRGAL